MGNIPKKIFPIAFLNFKKKMKQIIYTIILFLGFSLPGFNASAKQVLHFPMEVENESIYETFSGKRFDILGALDPLMVPGAKGNALRFDGYTSHIKADVNVPLNEPSVMTVSLWCAVETYPMMTIDVPTDEKAYIAGNINHEKKTGFGFFLGSTGKYSFECYTGGWKIECLASEKLPYYEWNNLVAVIDGVHKKVTLYNNGVEVAHSRCMDKINVGKSPFLFGRAEQAKTWGPFQLNTYNGIIDELCVYDEALTQQEIASWKAENPADLIVPKDRFAGNILRPSFHGMPGAGWTNESHGLIKYNGKYHVFFQKNANGPYMSRLHWGHITSPDLLNWTEERIAIAPAEFYDIKGCWSGCVFNDEGLTGGKPNIFYTGVDYVKAMMCQAMPLDDDLIKWEKNPKNPVVNGRPGGLSSDFRDPNMFKHNGNYYMIVGTSKNNVGATTLHRYDKTTKTWSNDGTIFFEGTTKNICGFFFEMPTINPIGDGKWLFTATPFQTAVGVETMYWVGTINDDGTFKPLKKYEKYPGKIELEGFGTDGYGLLSPSVTNADGKTIALGIVPDKLPSIDNYNMGWAHNYSLPREWSLDENDNLVQKPYEGVKKMRTSESYAKSNFKLIDGLDLNPVKGRKIELLGEFVIGNSERFGFKFFKNGNECVELYYSPFKNTLTVDMRSLPRIQNDGGSYKGLYESSLPESFKKGDIIKINAFIDHSIIDIFINDKWACSVRVFPTNVDAINVEAFSMGETEVRQVNAWNLDEKLASVTFPSVSKEISYWVYGSKGVLFYDNIPLGSSLSVYDLSGKQIDSFKVVNEGFNSHRVNYDGIVLVKVIGKEKTESFKCCLG